MKINIVGAGPNALVAGIRLAQAGANVTIFEAGDSPGGALRSGQPFKTNNALVDYGATAHPTGVISPAFTKLRLEDFGLQWLHPRYPMAHPLQNQEAVILHQNLESTLQELPAPDRSRWELLHRQVYQHPEKLANNILGPLLQLPANPILLSKFGLPSLAPLNTLARLAFTSERSRALLAGSAAHAALPLTHPFTTAFGILFGGLGMSHGWPFARGGSQNIINALVTALDQAGGRIVIETHVSDLNDLPPADVTILNLTPRQVLALKNAPFPAWKRKFLANWRYGSAASKVDFLLNRPVPWLDPRVNNAGTVHVGGTLAEVNTAESLVFKGDLPEKPFVMVSQPEVADPERNPDSKTHLLWTYAHVPHNYNGSVVELIVRQIERFAPGFSSTIVEYVETRPRELQAWNQNIIGGDIGGGSLSGTQQLFRPFPGTSPYRLQHRKLYLTSAATPPGGGAHGMAGWHCAATIMRDFGQPPMDQT